MISLVFLLALLNQVPKPAPVPGMPVAPGVYYKQTDGQWFKLEYAVMADMKGKGLGGFLETDGYLKLDITVSYPGAQARLQIPTPRPAFFVRATGAAKDAMIVQLTRGKDRRTIQTSSSATSLENKGGFKKQEIQHVNVVVYADESFSVTPQDDLKPGEYLLVFGYANTGFDFGITRPKK